MNQKFGQHSEQMVMNYVHDHGFKILACNYRKFFGEIDIIAQKGDTIIFVEVKARKNSKVSLHNLVTSHKQQKIIKVALSFIQEYGIQCSDKTIRFDVALLHVQDNQEPQLTYIANAFSQNSY